MEKLTSTHWTSRSVEDFTYRVASDFLAQVEMRMEDNDTKRSEVAQRLDRSLGRISQMFNPSNFTIVSAVRLASVNGMKVAVVAYDDGDSSNQNGPVNPEIFHQCWKRMGSPSNFEELCFAISPVKYTGYCSSVAKSS